MFPLLWRNIQLQKCIFLKRKPIVWLLHWREGMYKKFNLFVEAYINVYKYPIETFVYFFIWTKLFDEAIHRTTSKKVSNILLYFALYWISSNHDSSHIIFCAKIRNLQLILIHFLGNVPNRCLLGEENNTFSIVL